MKQPLITFLFILATRLVLGQSTTTFNYSLEEGLPSSETYQVYQDKEGFIWFATDNGIVRYDGKEMVTYHIKDGLSDPVIFGFQEDGSGRVWLRSFSGKLSYLENGEIKKYKYNDMVTSVVKNGLINFDYSGDELKFMSKNSISSIDSLGNLKSDTLKRDGLYYFGDMVKGVWMLTQLQRQNFNIVINGNTFPVELSKEPYTFSNYYSPSRCIHWQNKLFLTIRNNIFVYNGETVERVYSGPAPIISLSKDKDNNLWIGYINNGVEKVVNIDFKQRERISILEEKSVTSVLQDSDGGLWFSTLENGVYHLPNPNIENFIQNNSKIMQVSSKDDSVFISDQRGFINIFNGTNKEPINGLTFNSPAQSFFWSRKNNLFIYSDINIYVLDSTLKIKHTHKGLDALSFVEDTNGSIWTFGNRMICRFSEDGDLLFQKILPAFYRTFTIHNSLFFLAEKTGLQVRSKELNLVRTYDEFSDYKITKLIPLNDSILMVNTQGSGFFLLNTANWTHEQYNSENKFIANTIYTAIKKESQLWLGTESGIVLLDINSLLNGKPAYKHWGKKNGLINNDVKFIAITNQNIWAFSDNGYSIIPKNTFESDIKNPIPYLKNIVINESNISNNYTKKINLSHDKTNVGIHVGYLSFNHQDIISRYRIEKSIPWEYTKERSFQFTSLAPGDYSFELEYSIDNVHWIRAAIDFAFTVSPPWWQQWYFLTSLIIFVIFLVFLYTRYQIKNYQQKNRLLNLVNAQQQKLVHAEINITERERKRIAKELHDGIGTSITAIKLGVMSQLTRHLNGNVKIREIENQFQSTLKEIKDIAYDLTPPDLERYGLFTALSGYVNKLSSSVGKDIQLNTFGNDLPESEMALSVFRILQELISNSLKHANAEHINITINAFNDLLSIIFEDDGIGFEPAKIKKGLGLANIESRVQLLNGTIQLEREGSGVSYLIDIPLTESGIDKNTNY